jgi:kynurenine 3-monooxygenase
MKYARMDYQQEYIDCLWCEFTMPRSKAGDFAISPNHLHIWPAGSFMFIALPNLDKSFVCTLFGPVELFSKLESGSDTELVSTFDKYFPGVSTHIPPADLAAQFKRNPHLPLINIKCSPHHFGDSAVIVGDAANAMVPFYGQGMNAGLESVRVLFSKLDSTPDREQALAEYSSERTEDAHVIADLALANYTEMRSSVTSPLYKWRKWIEEQLDKYVPSWGWATQYSRVSFSNMRYSHVINKARSQKRTLTVFLLAAAMAGTTVPVAGAWWLFGLTVRHQRMFDRTRAAR